MRRLALAVSAVVLAAAPACGGGDGTPVPVVDSIDEAIAAVEQHYGAPQRYFEVSATIDEVQFVVAVDDATAAEQGRYSTDGGLTIPEPVGPASGATFAAGAIDFDPDRIFDQLNAELDDPVIVDFAIQGTQSGSAVYDATVRSNSGGLLRVLLGPTGQILGAQAR